MSADGGLFLDHVAVVVSDLARAAKTYARLGFQLTPESSHKGPVKPGGPLEPYGSGNHCAMFKGGYLEILGITDPNRYTGEVSQLLQRYAGLHRVALGCRDARQAARDLGSRLGAELTIRELGRDVPQVGGGTKPAQFRIIG
ncbi:MAG: VOC family protein, partial [Stellaceae bacterium]